MVAMDLRISDENPKCAKWDVRIFDPHSSHKSMPSVGKYSIHGSILGMLEQLLL